MKVLFLSFHFEPDLCAGSFRAAAVLSALMELLPEGSTLDLITTMPNRYKSFSAPPIQEKYGKTVSIKRVDIPAHRSGMFDQSIAFAVYARAALKVTRSIKYDLVVATSSRLMTAVLGAWIAKRNGARLYLDIRDIFADTIREVLPGRVFLPFWSLASFLERKIIESASHVNLVSFGFSEYFTTRYPNKSYSYFSNGIDDDFLNTDNSQIQCQSRKPGQLLSIIYAGNIGEGQGLSNIIPELAKSLEGKAIFSIIGDGGRRNLLAQRIAEFGLSNVHLLKPMTRNMLVEYYKQADILFLHLNDYDAFKKVLPSKIFEYGATGKPILAGVSGYAAAFIHAEIENAAIFSPCNLFEALKALDSLAIQHTDRSKFIATYSRNRICRQLAESMVACGSGVAHT